MPLPVPLAGVAIWTAVTTFIASIIPTLVGWVIITLGITLVSFTGFTLVFSGVESFINSRLSELPNDVFNALALMGVLDAIAIYFAALTASISIKTIYAGKNVSFRGFNLTGGSQ